MTSRRRHPYLTKEFWDKNTYWRNELHKNHELYEETYKNIMDSFIIKEDHITSRINKKN